MITAAAALAAASYRPPFQKSTPRVLGEKLQSLGFVHITGLTVSKNFGPPKGFGLTALQARREFAGTWTRLCEHLIVAVLDNGEIWMTSFDPAAPMPDKSVTQNMLSVICPRGFLETKRFEEAWADFLIVQGSPKGLSITGEKILARMRSPYSDAFGNPALGFSH